MKSKIERIEMIFSLKKKSQAIIIISNKLHPLKGKELGRFLKQKYKHSHI